MDSIYSTYLTFHLQNAPVLAQRAYQKTGYSCLRSFLAALLWDSFEPLFRTITVSVNNHEGYSHFRLLLFLDQDGIWPHHIYSFRRARKGRSYNCIVCYHPCEYAPEHFLSGRWWRDSEHHPFLLRSTFAFSAKNNFSSGFISDHFRSVAVGHLNFW